MSLIKSETPQEDEQAAVALCPSPQQEPRRRRRHRPSGTGSYRNRHQIAKLTETSARNSTDGSQRWKNDDVVSIISEIGHLGNRTFFRKFA